MLSAEYRSDDRIVAQLREEFLADARERIDLLQESLWDAAAPGEKVLLTIRREVHSLKGMGASLGFPAVTLIAHRLEGYIAGLPVLTPRHRRDVEMFVDRLRDIVALGKNPLGAETAALLRGLPSHPSSDPTKVKSRNVEILLVTPSKTVGRILIHALRSLGYHVTIAGSPWESIQMAVCAQPDLIITSAVMEGLDGIDLARVFRVMTATRELPVAVLTSYSRDHKAMRHLPSDIPLIRLGASLDNDLVEVITGSGLI